MRKLYRPLLTAACLGLSVEAFAQGNLLPNASFEEQKVTPSGNRNNVLSATAPRDELVAWRSTNSSTPDYLATNAPSGSETDPFNYTSTWGYVQPYNYDASLHNGMVGIFAYGGFTPLESEYITPDSGPLSLPAGTYYAAFRASRSRYSTDYSKLGMNLTTTNPLTTTSAGYYTRASTSIESAGFITNNSWNLVSGKITIPSAGQYYVNIGNFDVNGHGGSTASDYVYYFIDEIQLFKVPAANPSGSSVNVYCGTSVVLGERSSIPGATYAWTVSGNTTPFATTSQVTITPTANITYTLTVTLPDNSTSASTVAVNITAGSGPTITYGLDLNTDNTCGDKTVRFTVSAQDRANNPGATFELTATGSNYVLTYGSADHSSCNIRIRNQSSFNVLATGTNACGRGPVFDTGTFTGRSFLDGCFTNVTQNPTAATAYPNPATESLTMPQSAEQAVLLNGQGKAVQKPDASGKLRVQDLPAGLYNLQMLQNGKLVNQRIEVKH